MSELQSIKAIRIQDINIEAIARLGTKPALVTYYGRIKAVLIPVKSDKCAERVLELIEAK